MRIGLFDESAATITLQPDRLSSACRLFRGMVAEEDEGSDSETRRGSPSDERKGPLLLPEPHSRQLEYRIPLPAGFTARRCPPRR